MLNEHVLAGGDCAGLLKVVLGLIGAAAVTVLRIAEALPGCENPPGGFSRLLLFEGRSSDCRTLAATWCCVLAATAENFGPSALCQ